MLNQATCRLNVIMCALVCSYCKPYAASDLKIVNGLEDKNAKFSSVIQVHARLPTSNGATATCSASVVGTHTLLTAGHCIEENNQILSGIFVRLDNGQEVNATFSDILPGFVGNRNGQANLTYDAAVIVFPKDTFKDYKIMPVSKTPPQPGDKIVVVGWGKFDHDNSQSGGKRRFGGNNITYVRDRIGFKGMRNPIGNGTGVGILNSQGDSGGPMLNVKGEIIGVSSTVDATSSSILEGHYVNLQDTKIAEFLKNTQSKVAAHIAGVHDSAAGQEDYATSMPELWDASNSNKWQDDIPSQPNENLGSGTNPGTTPDMNPQDGFNNDNSLNNLDGLDNQLGNQNPLPNPIPGSNSGGTFPDLNNPNGGSGCQCRCTCANSGYQQTAWYRY